MKKWVSWRGGRADSVPAPHRNAGVGAWILWLKAGPETLARIQLFFKQCGDRAYNQNTFRTLATSLSKQEDPDEALRILQWLFQKFPPRDFRDRRNGSPFMDAVHCNNTLLRANAQQVVAVFELIKNHGVRIDAKMVDSMMRTFTRCLTHHAEVQPNRTEVFAILGFMEAQFPGKVNAFHYTAALKCSQADDVPVLFEKLEKLEGSIPRATFCALADCIHAQTDGVQALKILAWTRTFFESHPNYKKERSNVLYNNALKRVWAEGAQEILLWMRQDGVAWDRCTWKAIGECLNRFKNSEDIWTLLDFIREQRVDIEPETRQGWFTIALKYANLEQVKLALNQLGSISPREEMFVLSALSDCLNHQRDGAEAEAILAFMIQRFPGKVTEAHYTNALKSANLAQVKAYVAAIEAMAPIEGHRAWFVIAALGTCLDNQQDGAEALQILDWVRERFGRFLKTEFNNPGHYCSGLKHAGLAQVQAVFERLHADGHELNKLVFDHVAICLENQQDGAEAVRIVGWLRDRYPDQVSLYHYNNALKHANSHQLETLLAWMAEDPARFPYDDIAKKAVGDALNNQTDGEEALRMLVFLRGHSVVDRVESMPSSMPT
ncbi:MAG: hypothetical protein AB7F28_05850 [Candidatus Margulisiibacteriota bacterium]